MAADGCTDSPDLIMSLFGCYLIPDQQYTDTLTHWDIDTVTVHTSWYVLWCTVYSIHDESGALRHIILLWPTYLAVVRPRMIQRWHVSQAFYFLSLDNDDLTLSSTAYGSDLSWTRWNLNWNCSAYHGLGVGNICVLFQCLGEIAKWQQIFTAYNLTDVYLLTNIYTRGIALECSAGMYTINTHTQVCGLLLLPTNDRTNGRSVVHYKCEHCCFCTRLLPCISSSSVTVYLLVKLRQLVTINVKKLISVRKCQLVSNGIEK